MILILHGDNIVASRQALNQKIKQLKSDQLELIRLYQKDLTPNQLIQALESSSLFGQDRLVVIENLFSQPQSSIKSELIGILAKGTKTKTILWEKKPIATAYLKKLSLLEPEIKLFKTPAIIFQFLDSIRPDNQKQSLSLLHQALSQNPAEAIFYFLCRRLSQLIQALDQQSNSLKGAGWQQTKLKNQAEQLKLEDWIKLHQRLLHIDHSIKTGKNLLPLASQLDLFILDI